MEKGQWQPYEFEWVCPRCKNSHWSYGDTKEIECCGIITVVSISGEAESED